MIARRGRAEQSMVALKDASGVRQHCDAFAWLTNTCFKTNRAGAPDTENQFATYAMEFLQSHAWSAKSMQKFAHAFRTFELLKANGDHDAGRLAQMELSLAADEAVV